MELSRTKSSGYAAVMIVRPLRLAVVLLAAIAAPAMGQTRPADAPPAAAVTPPAEAATPPVKDELTPPTLDLQLIRVGGGSANGIVEYFDETSVIRGQGTATVWRLYVLVRPRRIGRLITQGVWALSDFDCNAHTVEPRGTAMLGISLEPVAHGSKTLADSLFAGELASALVARHACDGRALDGERFASVSAAVRSARATVE
jgi:hypothetical protein